MKRIGLIAGSGQFPVVFSGAAKEKGLEVFAVAHKGETEPDLESHVKAIEWISIGQLNRLISFFGSHGVKDAVMAGGITKTKAFSSVRPDLKALKLLASMVHTQDDNLLRAFARELEESGITIHAPTFLLPELLAQKGTWTRRKPSKSEMADVHFGWEIVKEIGRLDIGQTVVVRDRSVMAVEAIDGTDATIKRGGELGRENTVVVKASKPNQDMRFDLPAIGVKTIQIMGDARASVLAVEAERTVVFDKEEVVALANKHGIVIMAL
jgi:hypothetical protein